MQVKMNKAVFLDRDGTIARDVRYCRRPEDFEIFPTVPEAIKLLNDNGFMVVVITNQSGIARGYFDEETLARIHQKMKDELAKYGAWVDAIYYCPHHPDDACQCRKPKTALFHKAAKELNIDFKLSYVVGDLQMDIDAGRALGCKTALVTTGPQSPVSSPQSPVSSPQSPISSLQSPLPDYIAENLLEAARWIVGQQHITTSIIVPAYNEEGGLPIVMEKVFKVINGSYEVIVVDDGSDDRTSEVASQFPCHVIRHEVNRGKGEALKTGFRSARGENIISMDADDTYPAELIPLMSHALHFYDVVIGSRVCGRNNIPRFNRIGNFIIRTLIRGIYGFKPFDPLTGLWGVKKCYVEKISPTVRYAPDAEMWIKATRLKLQMLDIPITYRPRIGQTKLHSLKGGWEHLKLIISLLFWKPK